MSREQLIGLSNQLTMSLPPSDSSRGIHEPSTMTQRSIVFFTPGHSEAGGAAQRSRRLAELLACRGWRVRVVTHGGTLRRPRRRRAGPLTVIEVPGFGHEKLGAVLFLAVACCLGVAWGRKAQVYIALQLSSPATAAGICSLLVRRPLILMASSTGPVGEIAYVVSSPLFGLRKRILGRASIVVAQTRAMAEELEALAPPHRITVLPNPSISVHAPALNGLPRAVYTGRFSREKDLLTLLAAWPSVVETYPDAELTLVGEGGRFRSVEQEMRELLQVDDILRKSVTITGWVTDTSSHLRYSDVYVLPSITFEGMSNSLVEACSWHRIAVASDIPANRAVLGEDYPLYFRAGDANDMAAALRRAFSEESVRAVALQRVRERAQLFAPDAVAQQFEQIIDQATNRARN
jgi:glycosyltransferase involved in cell wall biosynthesis